LILLGKPILYPTAKTVYKKTHGVSHEPSSFGKMRNARLHVAFATSLGCKHQRRFHSIFKYSAHWRIFVHLCLVQKYQEFQIKFWSKVTRPWRQPWFQRQLAKSQVRTNAVLPLWASLAGG